VEWWPTSGGTGSSFTVCIMVFYRKWANVYLTLCPDVVLPKATIPKGKIDELLAFGLCNAPFELFDQVLQALNRLPQCLILGLNLFAPTLDGGNIHPCFIHGYDVFIVAAEQAPDRKGIIKNVEKSSKITVARLFGGGESSLEKKNGL
jgi:hypothetical protein